MKFYMHYFHFSEQNAGNPTIATLVLLSAVLTGLGVYDKIGQFGGLVQQFLLLDLQIQWQVRQLSIVVRELYSGLRQICLSLLEV